MIKEISVAILAGGKSSRMGEDKGLIHYLHKPMIQYTIDAVKSDFEDVFILSGNEAYEQFELPLYKDEIKEVGPLGGIYTALKKAKNNFVLILPCDTPLMDRLFVQSMVQQHSNQVDVLYTTTAEKMYPLNGIYSKEILEKVEDHIHAGKYKVRTLFNAVKTAEYFVSREDSFKLKNINTREDLESIG